MKLNFGTRILISIPFTLTLASCSSALKVSEFEATADPQVELERVEGKMSQAEGQQVNLLSPTYFEAANRALDRAKKARGENQDQGRVLHDIATAQANLDKAINISALGQQILKDTLTARQAALEAKAESFYPKQLAEADLKLKGMTAKIEDGDTSAATSEQAEFSKVYKDLELSTIKKDKLGKAQAKIQEARDEGAAKLTPETLAWANDQITKDDALITRDRTDKNQVEQASADANTSAERLLTMVRAAKSSSALKPEERARIVEANGIEAAQSKESLEKAAQDLRRSKDKSNNLNDRNTKLESDASLDREFEIARGQFSENEAEVYKQGNKLLLRLKGLTFVSNGSGVQTSNFELLAKVQRVLNDLGPSRVEIEGHTDSLGGKKLNASLSTMRAESVKSYLVANNNVPADKVTSAGFGDTKPLATNKTAKGRAQNRRVDILISKEVTQQ